MNINIHNYETYFLLYIDNELSIAERAALEQFIEANPNYANELNALKNTVSETENITFKDKFLLYRWEEMEASIPSSFKHNLYREEAKIITGFFTRKQILTITSIAAVVLLLIGYPMFFDNVITNNNNGLVYNNSNGKSFINDKPLPSNANSNVILENNLNSKHTFKKSNNNESNLLKSNLQLVEKQTNFIALENTDTKNILLVPNTTNIIPENTFPTISENSFVANAENESNNNAIPTNATISNENMNTINMDENDRSLYIASFEIDGEKLRGVTRRINAYLRRNKNEKQK